MHENKITGRTLIRITTAALLSTLCAGLAWAGPDARTLLKESENRHRTKKHPGGPSLKLLNILDRKGIEVLI